MAVVVREALEEYRERVDPQISLPLMGGSGADAPRSRR
jgi:hypothetical protein